MNDARSKNFVAPAPARRIVEPERQIVEHATAQSIQPPVRLESVAVSAMDRAVAFNVSTAGLALVVGLGGALIAAGGWQVPLFSVTALAIFFSAAGLVWLAAWLVYSFATADGVALLAVLLQYRLLRHEQRARHERIAALLERDNDDDFS